MIRLVRRHKATGLATGRKRGVLLGNAWQGPAPLPLERRFTNDLATARRIWTGADVLRVFLPNQPYQVAHFFIADHFVGWYINFESPGEWSGDVVESRDWHLDLAISPDGTTRWQDEEEAAAALEQGQAVGGQKRRYARPAAPRRQDPAERRARRFHRLVGEPDVQRPARGGLIVERDWPRTPCYPSTIPVAPGHKAQHQPAARGRRVARRVVMPRRTRAEPVFWTAAACRLLR